MNKIQCLECGKMLKAIGKNHLKSCPGRAKTQKEYLLLHPGAEIMTQEVRASKAVSLQRLTEKYGEIEGTKRFNDYRKKQSIKNSFEHLHIKRGWSYAEFEAYNKSRGVTLKNQITKYGANRTL